MTESIKFIVREAKSDDMYQVYHLIKALAEYEKLDLQVQTCPKVLIEDGFGKEHPAFKCLVAEDQDKDNSIIGYAIYYTIYNTSLGKALYLEDLYVVPSYRKCGIGKEMMLRIAKTAYETSKCLDFHILSWSPAIEFYKKFGAVNLTETEKMNLYRLDEDCLAKLFKR